MARAWSDPSSATPGVVLVDAVEATPAAQAYPLPVDGRRRRRACPLGTVEVDPDHYVLAVMLSARLGPVDEPESELRHGPSPVPSRALFCADRPLAGAGLESHFRYEDRALTDALTHVGLAIPR